MKDKFSKIIIVLLCVMLVFNFVQIRNLEREIGQLRNALNTQTRNLESSIANIYREVDNMLEKEANVVSVYDWSFGAINVEKRTAQIDITVVPKEYTLGVTKVSVLGNGEEHPLTLQDGQYKASISVPLFETSNFSQVLIKDGNTVRTEAIGLSAAPSAEMLMDVTAGYSGKTNLGQGFYPSWFVTVHIHNKGEFQVQSMTLVEVLNGKEVGRKAIDISEEGQAAYLEQVQKNLNHISVPENVAQGETVLDGSATFVYYLNDSYQFTDGRMELYVEVVDEYGLHHWALLANYAMDADGKPINDELTEGLDILAHIGTMYIYDENGTLLYELDKSLYM